MLPSHTAIKDLSSLKDRNQHTLLTVPNINDQTICLSFNVIYFPLLSFTFFFFFNLIYLLLQDKIYEYNYYPQIFLINE